jgi:hypothetical protein
MEADDTGLQLEYDVQRRFVEARPGIRDRGQIPEAELFVEGRELAAHGRARIGGRMVHVFHEPVRDYYDLDGLWREALEVPVPEDNPAVQRG